MTLSIAFTEFFHKNLLTISTKCDYNGGKAKHLITSGLSAPKDLRLFLYPMNVGGAENKRGFVRIISLVLYRVFSPRRLTGSGLLNKGYKKMQELVSIINNQIKTTSNIIASTFGKAHKDVLRRIESLEIPDDWHQRNFTPMLKTVDIGGGATRHDKAYEITRDGFTLLAMGFTGKKAMEFKIKYIDAFNKMEAALKGQNDLGLVPVSSYTRRLPSGPREIKLSDKARSEIGGIVKACIGSALKDITVTQTVDPIGYNIPESLKQPDVVPAEVEKELWRLTEQLHYGLQKKQPNTQNTSVLNLFYLLRALKTVLTRYRTVQNETLFAVDMMKGDKNYEKDEALERIYILNALTNGALRVC